MLTSVHYTPQMVFQICFIQRIVQQLPRVLSNIRLIDTWFHNTRVRQSDMAMLTAQMWCRCLCMLVQWSVYKCLRLDSWNDVKQFICSSFNKKSSDICFFFFFKTVNMELLLVCKWILTSVFHWRETDISLLVRTVFILHVMFLETSVFEVTLSGPAIIRLELKESPPYSF